MTNNPTIDGVSRELLEEFIALSIQGKIGNWVNLRNELRALLDAPAVERQEPYRVLVWWSATGARKPDWNPSLWGSINEAVQYHGAEGQITKEQAEQQGDWLSGGQWFSVPLYEAAPEVAALQSTIAQLQARITQLESEAEFAAATYQAARDRIAELESARGEQIGMLLIDEYFDNREIGEVDVQLDSEACEKLARDFPGRSLPVFVGPTALPDRCTGAAFGRLDEYAKAGTPASTPPLR